MTTPNSEEEGVSGRGLARVAPDAFDRAAAVCRLDDTQLAAARAVLVDGLRQADVAREAGVTRQYIHKVVDKVREAIHETTPAPAGWIVGTVVLPPAAWPAVRAIEQRARAALRAGGKPKTRRM